jgi:hypothetical protein
MLHAPQLLFLEEQTMGADVVARIELLEAESGGRVRGGVRNALPGWDRNTSAPP